jgi:hypothetical protein
MLIFPYYGMAPTNGTYHKNNYVVFFVTAQENLFLINCPYLAGIRFCLPVLEPQRSSAAREVTRDGGEEWR